MVTHMSDIAEAIGRVRRAMPRNQDVMLICDELDNRLRISAPIKPKLSRAEIQKNYRLRKKAKK
jgi:hypothetical protein